MTRVCGVLVKDNKILLALHKRFNEEYFVLPGGGLEKGESHSECLVRAFKEKADLSVRVGGLLLKCFDGELHHREEFYYAVKLVSGVLNFSKNPDLKGGVFQSITWVDLKNLEKIRLYPKAVKEFLLQKYESFVDSSTLG